MPELKETTPKRRTDFKQKKRYNSYKKELREDFSGRCGYCNDQDSYRNAFYEIDHFVPKKHLNTIPENDYGNLVYACRHCNNAKWDKWPTEDEKRHNNRKEGFIDPCNKAYDEQFERNRLGEIRSRTTLGKYMHKALKLYLRRHAVIWNLERIDSFIDEIENLNEIYPRLKETYTQLLCQYRSCRKKLDADND